MSAQAVNAYRKDASQLRNFVLVDGVYYLASEDKAKGASLAGQVQAQVQKAATLAELENTYCAEDDFACRDFVYMVYLIGETENMQRLVNGAKADFAQALRNLKRLYMRGAGSGKVALVEKRQYKRLIGDNYDIAALRDFLEQGEFTLEGWRLSLDNLCWAARQGKLTKQQVKEVKKLAKRARKGEDNEDLPVIRLTNVNPFAMRELIPSYQCIETL